MDTSDHLQALYRRVAALEAQSGDVSLEVLFYRLWIKAVGTLGYDKRDWMDLHRRIGVLLDYRIR